MAGEGRKAVGEKVKAQQPSSTPVHRFAHAVDPRHS